MAEVNKAEARRIVAEVAAKFFVGADEIMGERRYQRVAAARHWAYIEVARAFPGTPIAGIARFFNRDHSTILHCFNRHGWPHNHFQALTRPDDLKLAPGEVPAPPPVKLAPAVLAVAPAPKSPKLVRSDFTMPEQSPTAPRTILRLSERDAYRALVAAYGERCYRPFEVDTTPRKIAA